MRKLIYFFVVGFLFLLTACGSEPVDENEAEEQNQQVDDNDCVPATCQELDVQCGTHDDGCEGIVDCEGCEENMTCSAGQCVDDEEAPPSVIDLQGPADPTASSSADFDFDCSKPGCEFSCRLGDDDFEDCSPGVTYEGLAEGEYRFEVYATDSLGVDSDTLSWEWTIDTSVPDVIDLTGPDSPTNETSATFDFACSKDDCTFECRVDEADFASCEPGIEHHNLDDGDHQFQVRATDDLGTTGGAATWNWTVDTVPPVVVIEEGPAVETFETDAVLWFSCADDDCVSFECALDTLEGDGNFEPCSSPETLEDLELGIYNFNVRGTDAAGNSAEDSHIWEIVEDDTCEGELNCNCHDDQTCNGDLECVNDTCVEPQCDAELLYCDQQCIDPQTNDEYCGDCDTSCAQDQTCQSGGCEDVLVSLPTQTVFAGGWFSCKHLDDGTVTCWGQNNYGQRYPPDEVFTSVTIGTWHGCGIEDDHTVTCWGKDFYNESTPPVGETFAQVDASVRHSCGVKLDGTVECWGQDDDDQATPLGGQFSIVSGGSTHSCGLRPNGVVECWGENHRGQAESPSEIFKQLATGGGFNCGITTDDTLYCWGSNHRGESSDYPPGTFSQVSAGSVHACAVSTDGDVECWGLNDDGQADPPVGSTFVQVSAGDQHSCGLTTDDTIECWGKNDHGQLDVPAGL